MRSERARSSCGGDAHALPFADGTFPTVVAMWVSIDVDDLPSVIAEVARVLCVGGDLALIGAHPCFNGPAVESTTAGCGCIPSTAAMSGAPWWRPGGIRETVGGMVHVPLADLLTMLINNDLQIGAVRETGGSDLPTALAIRATHD